MFVRRFLSRCEPGIKLFHFSNKLTNVTRIVEMLECAVREQRPPRDVVLVKLSAFDRRMFQDKLRNFSCAVHRRNARVTAC